jgi:hypothetical protein
MNSQLITSWGEHQNYLQKILLLTVRCLRILDQDLSKLELEKIENEYFLRRFLNSDRQNTFQLVLKDSSLFRRGSPRLMKLFKDYPERMNVLECPPHLSTLNELMVLADAHHALIRFDKEQVRSKAVIDNSAECRPYILRFEEILKEGLTPIGATTLGL